MKKYVVLMALLTSTLILSGCGWLFGDKGIFRDRGDDYRRATVENPIVVPPGLSKAVSDEDFAIPSIAYSAPLEGKFVVPRPEPLAGNPDGELVKIQRLDESSWILVEAAPGEVWPRVRQFLTTNQLTVVRADATAGIIETAWLQPKADGVARERYRLRIEQGVQRGSSEVYIVQADSRAGESQWPAASSNREREGEMIKALAQFIADNGSAGAVSMLAQRGLDSRGKVFLHKAPGENAYLQLDLNFERAWASFTTALPKAGFTVEDTNRTERKVWVRYEPPKEEEEKKGWWSRFWSWVFWSADPTSIHSDVVYVLTVQPESGSDSAVRIGVVRQDGKPTTAAVEEELLNHIKNKLS
jgi:outer membrane protein assembly factor BamC